MTIKIQFAFFKQKEAGRCLTFNCQYIDWRSVKNKIIKKLSSEKNTNDINLFDGYLIDDWENHKDEIHSDSKKPLYDNFIFTNPLNIICLAGIEEKEKFWIGYDQEIKPKKTYMAGYCWRVIKSIIINKTFLSSKHAPNSTITGSLVLSNSWKNRKLCKQVLDLNYIIQPDDIITLKIEPVNPKEDDFFRANPSYTEEAMKKNQIPRFPFFVNIITNISMEEQRFEFITKHLRCVPEPDIIKEGVLKETDDMIPPDYYVCKKCGIPGHFVQFCNTVKTTGIPKPLKSVSSIRID